MIFGTVTGFGESKILQKTSALFNDRPKRGCGLPRHNIAMQQNMRAAMVKEMPIEKYVNLCKFELFKLFLDYCMYT